MGSPVRTDAWCGLEEHRLDLQRRLKPRCRDENEVDDLIQETFLRAARYRRSQAEPARLRAWLMQIAGNVHRDHVRRESRYHVCEPGDELFAGLEGREEVPGDPAGEPSILFGRRLLEPPAARSHLAQALAGLPVRDRTLLDSYYLRGGGTRAVAECTGLERSAVKVRLFRVRRRLKRAVGRALAREGRASRPWAEACA